MGSISKSFAIVLVFVFLILLSLPNILKADTSNDSNINCKLTTISPNSNAVYVGTMPLDFMMYWTVNTVVPFMYVNTSYSIDDGEKISISDGNNPMFNPTAQGTYYHYEYVIFPPNSTSTVSEIDISYLTGGAHKLTLFADGFYNLDNDFINPYDFSSSPIYFSVNYLATYPTDSPSPTATPSPTPIPTSTRVQTQTPTLTVPEFPTWIFLLSLTVIASTSLLVYLKKHKH